MITITDSLSERQKEDVWELLKVSDRDFVPSLSSRNNTVQKDLAAPDHALEREPSSYFEALLDQSFLLYEKNGHIKGFISFIDDYSSDIEECSACIYISTVIVAPSERQKGITQKMYGYLFEQRKGTPILTRTWSQNGSHIHILTKLGFDLAKRIPNDRGEGIDTVYYLKGAKRDE